MGTGTFHVSPNPEICASEVITYDLANGIVDTSVKYPNTDEARGGTCVTAQDAERGSSPAG